MKRTLSGACLVVLLASFAAAQYYTVTDLGTPPGAIFSAGYALNNAGQVAGVSGSSLDRGFFWSSTQGILTLPPLGGGNSSTATAINDGDTIAGYSNSYTGHDHAVLWINGVVQDLGTLPGGDDSFAFAINTSGQVAGAASSPITSYLQAILWSKAHGMQNLGALVTAGSSEAVAINRFGKVVGISDAADGGMHAFVWTKAGGMQDLGTISGSTYSSANGVNDRGEIAGYANCGTTCGHALFWSSSGTLQDLGALGGLNSYATGINNSGQVVGWVAYHGVGDHGFIWSQSAGAQDLNHLIDANSGWVIQTAYAINDNGQITGDGMINGQLHAFLLTPTTEVSESQ